MTTPPPMAWIASEPAPEDVSELSKIYTDIGAPADGEGLDHVLKIHALMPKTLKEHLAFYQGILRRKGPLSRIECEIIGVAVSVRNRCEY